MRLAVLADVHGNLPALLAVMQELERMQPDYVLLNGDLINAVPFSAEVLEVVCASDWVVVRGNHEFYYLDYGTERALVGSDDPARWGQLHWLLERISPEQGEYLALLPDERTLYLPGTQPLRMAHGVPGRNRVGFYNEQPAEAIAAELVDVAQRTMVSAHTHVQVDRVVSLAEAQQPDMYADPHRAAGRRYGNGAGGSRRWHVINPGSVGLPLNRDPRAQFALLESVPESVAPGGWLATHHRVAYDRRPALEAYTTSGMWEAGGVITELFYWELVTAEAEIVEFYQWARGAGYDPDVDITGAFRAYKERTGRAAYVRRLDPLYHPERG